MTLVTTTADLAGLFCDVAIARPAQLGATAHRLDYYTAREKRPNSPPAGEGHRAGKPVCLTPDEARTHQGGYVEMSAGWAAHTYAAIPCPICFTTKPPGRNSRR